MSRHRVLIVDDEPGMLENCERLLSREGYDCRTLSDPLRFRAVLGESQPDVLLLDLRMPGADGMTLLTVAAADDPALPVIIMTAYATIASAVNAIREGAFDYLAKPFTADQLLVGVERAVRYRGLTVENRTLREQVNRAAPSHGIVGSSPVMARLLEQVARVAPTDANVLITGESGTGKELIARRVHAASLRKTGPFLPMDCAALPEGLMESELFGHERGAFTGAVMRKDGLLAAANGGTVFLDEIAELSPGLQAKLLRTLEERQIRRLGSTGLVDIDIRVVAATSVDLTAAVAADRFRHDLYYRLNVVNLELPPLRARQGDILLLVQTFLEQFAETLGKPAPKVSPDACAALEAYDWPGNVREARNLAHRFVVLDDDGRVTLADLPETMRGQPGLPGVATPHGVAFGLNYEQARESALETFRSEYVKQLLARHGGNISQAARAAGVSRRTLHRWLAEDRAPGNHAVTE